LVGKGASDFARTTNSRAGTANNFGEAKAKEWRASLQAVANLKSKGAVYEKKRCSGFGCRRRYGPRRCECRRNWQLRSAVRADVKRVFPFLQ
jgi:hypothetical protein